MTEWHIIKEKEVFERLKSSERGLTEEQVNKKLGIYGANQLTKLRKLNALKILASQFFSFLILILIFAAIISLLLNHLIDFYVIMGIVIINGAFGFFQEYKAEKAIEKLKQMLVPKTKVLRDNKIQIIDSREVVPGDILVIHAGDRIMADARLISCSSLKVNEAPLTGESVADEKALGILDLSTPLADRTNMIYQGTQAVNGSAKAIVIATGMNTEYGRIASLVQKVQPEKNPLKEKLDKFAKNLALFTILLLVIITLIGVSAGFDKFEIFFTAVSLAVSVIPEGLPAVITLGLAFATQKMLKNKTLIRKLPAAETLGRATVICADKTGTITEEKMQVKSIYTNKKILNKFKKTRDIELLFKIGILCNSARIEKQDTDEEYIIGDPTEKALILAAKKYGLRKKQETELSPKIKEFAFTSTRKMMSVVRKNNNLVSYVKGAPEIILSRSNSELINGRITKITNVRREEIQKAYETLAKKGMRVLGFAYKTITTSQKNITQEKAEKNLIFVGFQAMIDPPRAEVKQAILDSEKAGIKVIMITGDSILTAIEVGKQIGLRGKAITSDALQKMKDSELQEEIKNISIFARISPEDKLRIVEALKANQEIVAVTGDGVNDAPALKRADIGIAVNRGTDVAKDSSDIILMDNNFASIPKAIAEGRRVYDNIKKFIKFLLASNFSEVILVLAVILIWRDPKLLPLLPIQILWINLVTDSFPALALTREKAEPNIMGNKPRKEEILKGIKGFIIISGFLAFLFSFILFSLYLEDITKARTMAVTTSIMFEMFLAFNCKSNGSVFKSPKNTALVYAVALSITLHLIALYTPVNLLFQFTPLLIGDWLKIIGLSLVGFFSIEGFKKLKTHHKS